MILLSFLSVYSFFFKSAFISKAWMSSTPENPWSWRHRDVQMSSVVLPSQGVYWHSSCWIKNWTSNQQFTVPKNATNFHSSVLLIILENVSQSPWTRGFHTVTSRMSTATKGVCVAWWRHEGDLLCISVPPSSAHCVPSRALHWLCSGNENHIRVLTHEEPWLDSTVWSKFNTSCTFSSWAKAAEHNTCLLCRWLAMAANTTFFSSHWWPRWGDQTASHAAYPSVLVIVSSPDSMFPLRQTGWVQWQEALA